MSFMAAKVPENYLGKAGWEGKAKGKEYKADFTNLSNPPGSSGSVCHRSDQKVVTFKGMMSDADFKALTAKATTPEQVKVLTQLRASTDWFNSVLTPNVISPIKN